MGAFLIRQGHVEGGFPRFGVKRNPVCVQGLPAVSGFIILYLNPAGHVSLRGLQHQRHFIACLRLAGFDGDVAVPLFGVITLRLLNTPQILPEYGVNGDHRAVGYGYGALSGIEKPYVLCGMQRVARIFFQRRLLLFSVRADPGGVQYSLVGIRPRDIIRVPGVDRIARLCIRLDAEIIPARLLMVAVIGNCAHLNDIAVLLLQLVIADLNGIGDQVL